MSFVVLVGLLVAVWGAFTVFLWRRVSVIPIVPFVPAALFGIGLLLNLWIDWSGTITIGVLHVAAVVFGWVWDRRSHGGGGHQE